MSSTRIIPVALLVVAGILSLSASLYGGISLLSDRHSAPMGMLVAYCIPLILLLPFFCVTFARPRLSVILQLCAAAVFLGADVLAKVQSCGNGHPCAGFVRTAIASFLEPVTLVPFMIAALQTLAIYMREPAQLSQRERRSI